MACTLYSCWAPAWEGKAGDLRTINLSNVSAPLGVPPAGPTAVLRLWPASGRTHSMFHLQCFTAPAPPCLMGTRSSSATLVVLGLPAKLTELPAQRGQP